MSASATGARQQILDVAARLLREQSYQSATVRMIAEQVGIKAGSIYHHFPSKDAIVVAVANEGVRLVHDAVAAALAALPPAAGPRLRLETAIRVHLFSLLQDNDYTWASLRSFPDLPAPARAGCVPVRRDYEAIWAEIVADGHEAGLLPAGVSPASARLLLLGAVNWAGEWFRPGGLGIDRLAAEWAATVFGPG